MNKYRGYIPGLHALRGYAALSVVVWHVNGYGRIWFAGEGNTSALALVTLTGTDAVTLFYVLSGFLLVSQLLSSRPHIDVRTFYDRRTRRILPLYYLVLLVTILFSAAFATVMPNIFKPEFNDVQFLAAAVFAAYIPLSLGLMSGMLSHLWSLGVEMGFYTLAPWLASARRVPLALTGVLALRLLVLAATPTDSPLNNIALYLKVDVLAIGGLFAWLWRERPNLAAKVTTVSAQLTLVTAWLILIAVETPSHNILIDYTVALASGLLIVNIAAGQLVIENRITRWLGDVSYGVYLWHMLILFVAGLVGLRGIALCSATIAATLALATITHRHVESPFLRKRKPVAPHTTTSANFRPTTEP